jgi:DNA-binding protein H-NS
MYSLRSSRQAGVIEKIRELMAKHGLTIADIEAHTGVAKSGARRGPKPGAKRASKSAVGAAKTPVASANGKLAPKYRDPKTGATWSGHARPPAWIKDVCLASTRTAAVLPHGMMLLSSGQ